MAAFALPDVTEMFRRLNGRSCVAFLDGRAGLSRAPWSHLAWDPVRRLRIDADARVRIDDVRRPAVDPLRAIDEFLEAEGSAGRTVIGALSYDLGRLIEPRAATGRRGTLPLVALDSFGHVLGFDHRHGTWSSPPPEIAAAAAPTCSVGVPRALTDRATYTRRFERAQQWISAGDVYQVNLAILFEAKFRGEPVAFYQRLAARNPAAYGAYLDFGEFQVVSNSPELFLERRDSSIATRPIKGTRPRGGCPLEDEQLREELRRDPKERAEHVMIVDLERSDLGRIAELGSVRVEEFETVETYPTLHHLESRVSGRLRPGLRFSDILRATFPGGSITGAPKIRAMQIIGELEVASREYFTGAILYYPPNGAFTMNLAIRTAVIAGGRIRYWAGGGLVHDSVAEREYRECLLKARPFLASAAVP
ncbi:MAG: aminodeoxychorismate synthase component I [Candidatus Binatia bacterium]